MYDLEGTFSFLFIVRSIRNNSHSHLSIRYSIRRRSNLSSSSLVLLILVLGLATCFWSEILKASSSGFDTFFKLSDLWAQRIVEI